MFVSQKCFVFFPSFGSVSPALASGYCTILGGTFTVPRFPTVVVGGAPFAGPYFFKKPFCKTLFGELLFQGPCKAFAGPQVQVKGATQVGLVLLAAGLLLLFLFP